MYMYVCGMQYACPEVEYFWRVEQVMKSSAHTLRVQILDREGTYILHKQKENFRGVSLAPLILSIIVFKTL